MEIKLSDFSKFIEKTGLWGATASALFGSIYVAISLYVVEDKASLIETNRFISTLALMSLGFAYRTTYSPKRIKKRLEGIKQMLTDKLLDEDQADIAQRSLAIRLADNRVYAIERTVDTEFDGYMEYLGQSNRITKKLREDVKRHWKNYRSAK